jgi:hypothetical protein
MIDQATFNLIKEKHGRYASWAVWTDGIRKPKENVGDLTVFNVEKNVTLLTHLNPNLVFVGLNISRSIVSPFGNFHDARPSSMDYKIRYALKGTVLWGAYMTDIIRDFEQKASGKMMAYLRKDKVFERSNVEQFRAELGDLHVDQSTLIAFGQDAFNILTRNLAERYDIWKVPHYSNYISKEIYRQQIQAILQEKGGKGPANENPNARSRMARLSTFLQA